MEISLTHKGFKECQVCLYSQDKYYASIAQSVEQLICNQQVVGSIPSGSFGVYWTDIIDLNGSL